MSSDTLRIPGGTQNITPSMQSLLHSPLQVVALRGPSRSVTSGRGTGVVSSTTDSGFTELFVAPILVTAQERLGVIASPRSLQTNRRRLTTAHNGEPDLVSVGFNTKRPQSASRCAYNNNMTWSFFLFSSNYTQRDHNICTTASLLQGSL